MIDPETYVNSARMEDVLWTIEEFLRVYEGVVSLWQEQGWTPDRVGGIRHTRAGASQRRLTKKNIELDGCIALEKLIDNWRYDQEWAAVVVLNNCYSKGSAHQILGSAQLGTTEQITVDASRRFLKLMHGRYAYILRQQRRYGYYQMAATEFDAHLKRHNDHRMNISWWGMRRPEALDGLLLRDIYPYNYLNQAYLDAKLGESNTTLREWIEADTAARGELKPFSEALTEWTPPVANIPLIRETLFRAGRMFYWRFFNPANRRKNAPPILEAGWGYPSNYEREPYYHPDLLEPWEANDPIPEIYQADFYRDKDPGLIY